MDVRKILEEATKREASDIFIIAGRPLTYKSKGAMNTLDDQRMEPKDTFQFVSAIYTLAERNIDDFDRTGDDDFSFAIPGVSRFRVSTFKQRGSYSAVIRVISFTLPHPSELGIPDAVMELADSRSGMILVTGPAGSGKSTTLACLIDKINHEREAHIITLEDPLEFLHRHEKSIVSQREINTDTENYLTALRAALRQSPDVILLGEMRDYETINTAVTAAETGHLIFRRCIPSVLPIPSTESSMYFLLPSSIRFPFSWHLSFRLLSARNWFLRFPVKWYLLSKSWFSPLQSAI